ncbi:Tat pathway signal protein [Streptomyces millisiae]|uniref:Tat pathway signal protein n=1 Tax=Streptomyces millisiae TaxID=3075542 RepID=A0ABU2LHI7_9ACTN|nr:Tat pathway signal protein [Streptomyces sp. DSM 44918]MDT0317033.1 Tat pathway signal protein [Streptomyces sp. DSM 44918]
MSGSLDRRSVLRLAGGTAGAAATSGWLWQAAPAHAAEASSAAREARAALDTAVFGDAGSEDAHGLVATGSTTLNGGLDQPARVLNPLETPGFWGGTLALTMACRPRGRTYVTIKLWGDDFGEEKGRLQLYAEGAQVGHFHLGAVDPLDIAGREPRTPGRFYFHTLPLPPELTEGRESVSLEIRSMGRIYPYGATSERYYYALEVPTRGVYRLYTHAEPYFDLADDEVTGSFADAPVRTEPGPEVLETIATRVANRVRGELNRTSVQGNMDYVNILARAYAMPGSEAHRSPAVPAQIVQSVDDLYRRSLTNPSVIEGNWMGASIAGQFLLQLREDLLSRLDAPLTGDPGVLNNPGFDDGHAHPTGWRTHTWSGSGTTVRDTDVTRDGGTASARITIPSSGVVGLVPHARVPVAQGSHTYTVWVRTENVTGSEGAYLDVLFFDSGGRVVGSENKAHATGGSHDWERVTVTLDTPATAVSVETQVRLRGPGTAWFDDLTLTPPSDSTYTPVIRRDAWAELLLTSREFWRRNRRWYTNQTMIVDLGIYLADRGLELLGSPDAWGEERARAYLYEAVGLTPWLGPENEDGTPTRPMGSSYHQVTRAGLTKELGYVGNYGEVQGWLALIHEVVSVFGGVRDDRLRDQLVKIAKTRAIFHHPALDADGYRTMRLETVIGWRDLVYPGKRDYDQANSWEGQTMQLAALVGDPDLTAYARQAMEDHQHFSLLLDAHLAATSAVVDRNLLSVQRDYEIVTTAPASDARLPMTPGQPDFVFADPENAVVAVKHGDEILYASLYWRARWGVNRLARIHHIDVHGIERSATVWTDVRYVPDGRVAVEPDWVNWEFNVGADAPIPPGGFPPPGETPHQAFAGQELPLAAAPDDVPEQPAGQETPFVGRAAFYRCQYGPYLIAMNTTTSRTYTLATRGFGASTDLVTGDRVGGSAELRVRPGTTVVLRRR